MSSSSFADLGVPTILTNVLTERGITIPTPIQSATLPDSLAGRDVLGRGRTGSGKTYAFLLPLVTSLSKDRSNRRGRSPRGLIVAPTRELVSQIAEALAPLAAATGLSTVTIFGGVGPNPQVRALQAGVDVIIACPGRLEDLIGQGYADLSAIEVSILDEADHMADLGFLPAVKRLLDKTPRNGQRMLFSATLDAHVDVIAKRYLHSPVTHHADSAQSTISTMHHHVLHIDNAERLAILVDIASAPGRVVMFTRTKHGAKKLAKQLNAAGVPSVDLHGNLSQNARVRNLDAFSTGKASALVATDIAARGIHVDDVALVVHADPPVEHKAYLHRSGRTARAGAEGTVITLMTDEQVRDVRSLTRAAGIKPTITRIHSGHPLLLDLAPGERTLVPGGLAPLSGSASDGGSSHRSGQAGQRGGQGGRSQGGRGQSGRGQSQGQGRRSQSGRGESGRGASQGGQGGRGQSGSRHSSGARTSSGSSSAASFSSSTRAGGRNR
ncbi:MAG: DEAD/DEAH box helicase [Ornithinimicrobium sp.]|uniref:DEAD/DEAH box helicase n=1 Tax=Ornithinimicrobium sp. TaxID=1977084 RepID=UPI0026DF72AA|nr:DEAD/DEAH box helicase [Ornithinimicrobium sp.]MDO5740221.1 DEAD/DEAH box helicase [Ornithinimicrobium sp.]